MSKDRDYTTYGSNGEVHGMVMNPRPIGKRTNMLQQFLAHVKRSAVGTSACMLTQEKIFLVTKLEKDKFSLTSQPNTRRRV